MFGFIRNKPDALEELKKEVRELRETVSQLKYENEIRIGELPQMIVCWGWRDPRPKVSTRKAVEMILERMGLEIKHTKGYDSTTLEKKPETPNGEVRGEGKRSLPESSAEGATSTVVLGTGGTGGE